MSLSDELLEAIRAGHATIQALHEQFPRCHPDALAVKLLGLKRSGAIYQDQQGNFFVSPNGALLKEQEPIIRPAPALEPSRDYQTHVIQQLRERLPVSPEKPAAGGPVNPQDGAVGHGEPSPPVAGPVESLMKTCSKCGETKPKTEFQRAMHMPDGLKKRCKACIRKYMQRWAESHGKRTPRLIRPASQSATPAEEDEDVTTAQTSKKCSKCKRTKPLSDFTKKSNTPDGYNYQCKSCVSSYSKAWWKGRKKNAHKVKRRGKRQTEVRKAPAEPSADGELVIPAGREIIVTPVHLEGRIAFIELRARDATRKDSDQSVRLDPDRARRIQAWLAKVLAA